MRFRLNDVNSCTEFRLKATCVWPSGEEAKGTKVTDYPLLREAEAVAGGYVAWRIKNEAAIGYVMGVFRGERGAERLEFPHAEIVEPRKPK